MATENTSKKRKRGPYLSYLTNPLLEEVPRSTLKCWSREESSQEMQQEGNVVKTDEDSLSTVECTRTCSGQVLKELSKDYEAMEEENSKDTVEMGQDHYQEMGGTASFISNSGPSHEDPKFVNIYNTSHFDPETGPASNLDDELTFESDLSYLSFDEELVFADDCEIDEETWEESWESHENIDEAIHEENQESDDPKARVTEEK